MKNYRRKKKETIFGIDMNVNKLFWRIIDSFGIRIVNAKLDIWAEVKSDLQMFYKV